MTRSAHSATMLRVVVVEVIVVAVVLFVVAAVVAGRGGEMAPFPPDRPVPALPVDRPLTVDDVEGVRFPLAFRGYRMAEVDEALDRVAQTLRARDAEIAVLHAELTASRGERR